MAKNTYSFHACFLFSVTGWLFFGGVFFASRAVHLRVAAFAVVSATAPVGPLAHTCSPHMSRLNRLDCENFRPAILMVVDHNFHRGRRLIVDLCRPLALHFHGDFAREPGQKGPGSRVANGSAEFFQRFRRTTFLCASALPPSEIMFLQLSCIQLRSRLQISNAHVLTDISDRMVLWIMRLTHVSTPAAYAFSH